MQAEVAENTKQAAFFDGMQRRMDAEVAEEQAPRGAEEGEKNKTVNCFICLDDTHIIGTAACGHWACETCLISWVGNHANCPTCRRSITIKDIDIVDIRAPSEGVAEGDTMAPEVAKYGTKPWAVVEYCKQALAADSSNKILIFSSYDESLKILSDTLSIEGVHNLLCSSVGVNVAEAMERFKEAFCAERVMLLNSTCTGAGTNLQEANYVIFLEPAGYNVSHLLATETQAIGRTVRIGQTRAVKVWIGLLLLSCLLIVAGRCCISL